MKKKKKKTIFICVRLSHFQVLVCFTNKHQQLEMAVPVLIRGFSVLPNKLENQFNKI